MRAGLHALRLQKGEKDRRGPAQRGHGLEPFGLSDIGLVINEASSVKGNGAEETADWIELYNEQGKAKDLTGWSITDDSADAKKFTFTGGSIPARGYLILIADKAASAEGPADDAHLNFGLSAKKGESLFLYDRDGNLVSRLQLPVGNIPMEQEEGSDTLLAVKELHHVPVIGGEPYYERAE